MGDRFSGLFVGRAVAVERLDAALEHAAGSTAVPLVGRSEELARVLAALERAAAGSGGALLWPARRASASPGWPWMPSPWLASAGS
jgi:hypothetical protein